MPIKGEMLLVEFDQSPSICDITRGLTGLYHYRANQYWLGGTMSDPSVQAGTTESGKEEILKNIHEMLPSLGDFKIINHCAGYRPMTRDKLPILGALPSMKNVYVSSGGGSKGILLSAGMGSIITDMIEGNRADQYTFLSPERFFQ
jgi:glycine/D-amino acid oxidase-like deaminating enzyme